MDTDIDILATLPHRPPMLMVDRVLALDEKRCVAIKNISYAEPCLSGHFPGMPIFPGVLTIEALAQACAVWMRRYAGEGTALLAGVDNARFWKPVLPGDQIRLEATFRETSGRFYYFDVRALKEDVVVCDAVIVAAIKK